MAALIRRSVLASFLLVLALAAVATPAWASGQAVLSDYADNGQLSHCYSQADYAAALKAVRPDQQQYGAAVDVIQQAQLQCAGTKGATEDAAATGTTAADVSGRAVLADYEDNGQINGCYTIAQYEDALRLIRPDQQQYGAAVDVIRQAEDTNLRNPDGACAAASATAVAIDDAEGDVPIVVWVIVGLAVGAVCAGAYGLYKKRKGN